MSDHAAVVELVRKAEQDASLQEALKDTKTPEDVVQVAADAGVTLTVDEIHAFRQHVQALQQQAADGELSEAELEQAAGGLALATSIALTAAVGMVGTAVIGGAGGLGIGAAGGLMGGILWGTSR